MSKEEMDKNVCMMLGVDEENLRLVSQITQAFLLSITYQLATAGEVELEEFGTFKAQEQEGATFAPGGFCTHFIGSYAPARG